MATYSNTVTITYQDPNRVFIERSDVPDPYTWQVIGAVEEPDTLTPASYSDTSSFTGGSTYHYQVRRYEGQTLGKYSNIESVIYEAAAGFYAFKINVDSIVYTIRLYTVDDVALHNNTVRISYNNQVWALNAVPTTDAQASPLRVMTDAGILAIQYYVA